LLTSVRTSSFFGVSGKKDAAASPVLWFIFFLSLSFLFWPNYMALAIVFFFFPMPDCGRFPFFVGHADNRRYEDLRRAVIQVLFPLFFPEHLCLPILFFDSLSLL